MAMPKVKPINKEKKKIKYFLITQNDLFNVFRTI